MQVWHVLHAARWNTGRKKIAKNSPSGHHRTNFSGCIFKTKGRIDNREKTIVKQQYLLHMSHNMANFGPLTAKIGLPVWGTPSANFNGFLVLPSLLQRRRSPEANQTLHDVWPSHGLVHYIYIFGRSCISPLTLGNICRFTSKSVKPFCTAHGRKCL